jgi:ribonuclease D
MSEAAWIDTTDGLASWLAGVGRGPLAVDTEADSFHHYREKVCLVQLTAGGRHALVDPLAARSLAPLRGPLGDPGLRKILHGADYDVRLLARDFDLHFAGLTDTMVAARLAGEPAVGLAALLARHVGVTIDKSQQRADWSRRPLSPAMRAYAVEDTRHLEELAGKLELALAELGRTSWLAEECERLTAVRWRDRRDEDPEPFRRVKGARSLDRAGLAVLRELWGWRDSVARRVDRPHFRVMRDEVLVAIAAAAPHGPDDLARVPGWPRGSGCETNGSAVLAAVARGVACPEVERPAVRVAVRERRSASVEARIARLRVKRDAIATQLTLDGSIVAPRSVVEEMAERWEAGDDPFGVPELRQWQIDLLRPSLS